MMSMRIFESPGTLKRYRGTVWEVQQTFQTPLEALARFVDVIMSASRAINGAMVIFDQVVFEPSAELLPLYAKYSLPEKWYGDDLIIEAQDPREVRELLQAMLSEWIDFLLVPAPELFVMYADHDEYVTFLAHRPEQLGGVVDALTAANFRAVQYVREL